MPKSNTNDQNTTVKKDETLAASNQLETGTGGFTLDDGKLYTYDIGSTDDQASAGVKGTWSGGSVNVENDPRKDLSTGTKKTLADYLGKITKNTRVSYDQGNSNESSIYKDYGKGNAFPIATETNENQKKFVDLNNQPSTSKWGYSSGDVLTKTNVSTSDDPVTKLREITSVTSPGFIPGKRDAATNVDSISGHELLRDASKVNSPVARYSKALIHNRFSSENTYQGETGTNNGLTTPQFLTSYKMGSSATKEEIANEGVSFGRLAQVGAALTAKASAEIPSSADGYDPNSFVAELGALLPGLTQLGVSKVETFALEARSILDSLTDENITEYDLINPNESSWGSLNNVLEKYNGLGNIGMAILAFALVLAMSIAISLFMFLINLGNKTGISRGSAVVSKYESENSSRYPFGKSRRRSSTGLSFGGFVSTESDYQKCVEYGALSFYNIDYNRFGLVASVIADAGDFAFNSSNGWMAIMTRAVIRSTLIIVDLLTDIVKQFSSGNILAGLAGLTSLFDAIKQSKFVKCMNIFAQLGDKIFAIVAEDNEDLQASAEGAGKKYSTIDKVAKLKGNKQDAFTGNRLSVDEKIGTTLAWATHRSPDMFIMPDSFLVTSIEGKKLGAPSLLPTAKTLKNGSIYQPVTGENARIDTDVRERMEHFLDAEYLPFYFHDVRTNEILSFHAFLTSLSDDYSVSYDSTDAYGRVESIKTYKSTARKIGLSFIVAATSPSDFDSMWLKINKLTTLIYPQFNEGKRIIGGADPAKPYKLTAPFSQQIAASPMIRLRVGDLIQSNYSKFALARLFGYGNSGTEVAGKPLTPRAVGQLQEDRIKQFEAAKTDPGFKWKIPSTFELPDIVLDGVFTKIKSEEIRKAYVLVYSRTDTNNNNEYSLEEYNRDNIVPQNIKDVIGNKQQYKVTVPLDKLVTLTIESDAKLEEKQTIDYDTQMYDLMSDDTNKGNAVAKSFRSSGGRGLAGFIESLAFDWYDKVTWNGFDPASTSDSNDRAPKMCKVTISFSPIHDITPGLDHTGMNRAPIYPIGPLRSQRPAPAQTAAIPLPTTPKQ